MTRKARFCLRSTARFGQLLIALGTYSAAACAQTSPQEAGIWLDDSGNGAVEIYVCADRADRLCGRIVWLREPLNAQGVPKRDRYNPKQELQTRPICGLPVLGNLYRVEEGGFDGGWIYDPKAGKSYSAAIQLARQDRLIVTGYVGVKFLSKSFTWTRAPAELLRCEGAPGGSQPIKATKPAPAQANKPAVEASAKPAKPTAAAASNLAPPSPPAPKPVTASTAPVAKPAAATKPVAATAKPQQKTSAATATSASSAKVSASTVATASTASKTAPGTKPVTGSAVPQPKPATAKKAPPATTETTTASAQPSAQSAAPATKSKPLPLPQEADNTSAFHGPFGWGE
jgi:uncharacterized protein (DUF2147 family)